MTSGHLKGALLEFIVRELMINCGFTSVKADGHYIYEQRGLFFINGKGAAHDADVLMEPPIQIPFSYPSRLLFECKSYERSVGLNVIRNGLGLRYDINEFEIVTDKSISKRKNNRRATYAISDRIRYQYQIGIASIEEFSKPAFEFAANNKIPLLSMRWFLKASTCDLFRRISPIYTSRIPPLRLNQIYSYLKDKSPLDRDERHKEILDFLSVDEVIGQILTDFNDAKDGCMVGLLETGDLLFMFDKGIEESFGERSHGFNTEATLHYDSDDPTRWTLVLGNFKQRNRQSELEFKVPKRILSQWREHNYDKSIGYTMKGEFFSRIFIFSKQVNNYGLPFTLVTLDSEWLDNLRERDEE